MVCFIAFDCTMTTKILFAAMEPCWLFINVQFIYLFTVCSDEMFVISLKVEMFRVCRNTRKLDGVFETSSTFTQEIWNILDGKFVFWTDDTKYRWTHCINVRLPYLQPCAFGSDRIESDVTLSIYSLCMYVSYFFSLLIIFLSIHFTLICVWCFAFLCFYFLFTIEKIRMFV